MRVIAIDGPAGSGKTTVARAVAARLGVEHLDTGAMYRSVAFAALQSGVDPMDVEKVAELALHLRIEVDDRRVLVDDVDATDAIRGPDVSVAVSTVAQNVAVRSELVRRQRAWAAARGGAVMEGRDIGSVVLPDADVKVYLVADDAERARRRARQDGAADVAGAAADVARRDRIDAGRAASPMVVAEGAVVIDTTGRTIEQVVDAVVALAESAKGDG
ncbi:MAG TPA: (d)CMP kinase [Acidimicrobiales bacterium]|nr:(d)CMP kinase [Acidimicrobiales bacterium]